MNKFLLSSFVCIVALSGWGYTVLYLAVVATLLCLCFFSVEKKINRFCLLVFSIAVLYESSLAFCSSLIGLSLIVSNHKREGACFLTSQLPLLISPFLPLPHFFLHPLSSFSLYIISLAICCKWGKISRILTPSLIITYGCALAYLSRCSWSLNPVNTQTIPNGYQIGSAISKFSLVDGSKQGNIVYNNDEPRQIDISGTLYLEHDAKTQWDAGNLSQERPWSNNVHIGSELIRTAIFRDGCWICNKGAYLKTEGARFVGGLFQDCSVKPLAMIHKGHLILGDSDCVIDCLAPYQRNLISYLAGSDIHYRLFHFICGITLVIFTFFEIPALLCLCSLFYIVLTTIPYSGDIRYVGRAHKWAHTDLGEGVVRVLQQGGKNVIFGKKNAKLLIVGEGYSAELKQEKVVILEPTAEVKIQGVLYRANVIPLGQAQEIVDARRIIVEGKMTNQSKLLVGDIVIIATGTPTAQSTELLWPF